MEEKREEGRERGREGGRKGGREGGRKGEREEEKGTEIGYYDDLDKTSCAMTIRVIRAVPSWLHRAPRTAPL